MARRRSLAGSLAGGLASSLADAASSSAVSFLLDSLTSSVRGAWSVSDRLSTDYTGALIRVRRASDNAEQDFGYDADDVLDRATLETFCAGTDGFVVTVYDQSGNGRDLTQATAANQPQIVSSGSVITRGTASTPAMRFDGLNDSSDVGGDYLARTDACGLTGNPGLSVWVNYQHNSATTDKFVWAIGAGVGSSYSLMTSTVGGQRFSHSVLTGTQDWDNADAATWGYYQSIYVSAGQVTDSSLYRNGVALSEDSPGSTATPALNDNNTKWGSAAPWPWFTADGWSSTLVILDATGDEDALETWFAARN